MGVPTLEKAVCFILNYKTQANIRVATSWKILDFFCCPGKSLNFVYQSWKIFGKFCRDLPGQNVNFFHSNWYLVIVQSDCRNYLHCEGLLKSFILLLKDRDYFIRWRTKKKIAILALAQTAALALLQR